MSLFSRYLGNLDNSDLDLSQEEKDLIMQAENAVQKRSQERSNLGQLLGGVAGGIAGLASGGSLSLPAIGMGSQLGGQIGSLIGGAEGESQANLAENRLKALREKNMKPILERQRRMSAVADLLGTYLPRGM